jgi:hypothetical protein
VTFVVFIHTQNSPNNLIMKMNWMVLALALGAVSCVSSQRLHTLNAGDLGVPTPETSATYTVMDATLGTWDSPANAAALHDEIDRQMKLRGYVAVEPGDFNGLQPDLVVFATFFDRPTFIPTGVRLNPASSGEKPQIGKTRLEDGTLLLQLKDSRSQNIFWLGHAQGLYDGNRSLNPETLRDATRNLFERYTLMPTGYQKRRELNQPRGNDVAAKGTN